MPSSHSDPHFGQPVLREGPEPKRAAGVIVYIHGRGGTAQSILSLHAELDLPGFHAIAPQAAGNTWYPFSFLEPLESNQPFLNSALRWSESIVSETLADAIASERIALVGFSQGACLALEYAARHPRSYGGLIGLTGGLIGPAGTPRNYSGSLAGTAVFLGTSDPDPHVPPQRVRETKDVLERMGASVELRVYPGMPHTINDDELRAARSILQRIGKK